MSHDQSLHQVRVADEASQRKAAVSDKLLLLDSLLSKSPGIQNERLSEHGTNWGDLGAQFLLLEYDKLTELWKHTDARIESGVNIYLTASAVVVSAIVFFSQWIKDITLFLSITTLAIISLSVTGIILAQRLLSAAFVKSEYTHARDLIRQYFADKSPEISQHLYFLSKEGKLLREQEMLRRYLSKNGLLIIHLWSSFLIWIATSTIIWLIAPNTPPAILYTLSVITALMLLVYLTINTERKVKGFKLRKQSYQNTQTGADPSAG